MGSLPGHGVENVRRPLINTMNLADLLPTSSIWNGEKNALSTLSCEFSRVMHCVTSGNTPFRLNLHYLGSRAHHGFRPNPRRQINISRNSGFANAALPEHDNLRFWQRSLDVTRLQSRGWQSLHHRRWQRHAEFQSTSVFRHTGRSGLGNGLDWKHSGSEWCKGHARTTEWNSTNHSQHEQNGASTITEFCGSIQDLAIREALTQYKIDGMMGTLLDADKDGLSLSKFTVFEIEELMDMEINTHYLFCFTCLGELKGHCMINRQPYSGWSMADARPPGVQKENTRMAQGVCEKELPCHSRNPKPHRCSQFRDFGCHSRIHSNKNLSAQHLRQGRR